MSEFTDKALTRLLNAINLYNPLVKIAISDIAITNPIIITDPSRNTKVVITPIDNSVKFKGKRTISYNRVDLQTIFDRLQITEIAVVGGELTTHDLLPLIFEQHDILLEPVDIVLEDLNTTPYTLTATTNSYGWLGSVELATGEPATVEEGFLLDDGSLFELDDGSNLFLDDMYIE